MEEPISVRITRLNHLILGNSKATSKLSKPIAEGLSREGLLDAFCLLYNECNKENLKKKDRHICEFVNKYRTIISETNNLRVNVKDFTIKSLIGKGYFGDVFVAIEKATNDVYAIKKIRKCAANTASQIKEERDIMANHSSEWITSLQYAFQDQEHLYLVMEYVPGGDLLSLMIRNGPFDEDLARFYLAEMTLALNALHSMGYVHRDIKPENILLDRFGHLKLADFGNSTHLNKDGNVISISPVGTPDYIAPELLQTLSTMKYTKSVHDVSCDYWSMGVIGYEFIYETTPFHENNVHETYSKILSHCEDIEHPTLNFPNGINVTINFRDLINKLVTKSKNRLTYEEIIEHPFFDGIDWKNLRQQVPPIIPTLSGEDDTSNFEDVDKKTRRSTFTKTQAKGFSNHNDFSGQNLPFLGYSYVYQTTEMQRSNSDSQSVTDSLKIKSKTKDMQHTIDQQMDEIKALQQELLTAQRRSVQTESLEKILIEAKYELDNMKEKLKDKTIELAACKTDIKTLRSSLKIEEEMRLKSDENISQVLNQTYQKWEKAKKSAEQQYEKQIAEKKTEITSLTHNLLERENELLTKVDECQYLQKKIENYKEMVRTSKEQSSSDKTEFDRNKKQITEAYETKIIELKDRLKVEKESKIKLTDELRSVRQEVNEKMLTIKNIQENYETAQKASEDLKARLNKEIEDNKLVRSMNASFQRKQEELTKRYDEATQEIIRLQEELSQHSLAKRRTSVANADQFYSAHGSLETINSEVEEQLRNDLMVAQEKENVQRDRADRLEKIVCRLEDAMNRLQSKPAEALLEKQNEKLGDELATVREQAIVDRQASRAAHLSLWKVEKQVDELQLDKKLAVRRLEQAEEKFKKIRDEKDEIERHLRDNESVIQSKEDRIRDLQQEIKELKCNIVREHSMWENAEMERIKEKSEIVEHVSKIHQLEVMFSDHKRRLIMAEKRIDGLVIENNQLIRENSEIQNELSSAYDQINEFESKLLKQDQNYAMLKEACSIMEEQLNELEAMHENEVKQNKQNCEKSDNLWQSLRKKDEEILKLKQNLNNVESCRIDAETKCTQMSHEIEQKNLLADNQEKQLIEQQQKLIEKTSQLFQTQETAELLSSDLVNIQRISTNYERELHILKEENSKILTELYVAKTEINNLQMNLKESTKQTNDLQCEIDQINGTLSEQKNYYTEREIKSEATQAQYKKLITYLQQKVDDLSTKKKKTFTEVLFGSNSGSVKKENICPNLLIDDSATVKRMEGDLKKERARSNQLKEQLLQAKTELRGLKTASAPSAQEIPGEFDVKYEIDAKPQTIDSNSLKRRSYQTHRFEMTLENKDPNLMYVSCLVCSKQIIVGHPYWKCKVCGTVCHRRCRTEVKTSCGGENVPQVIPSAPSDGDSTANSDDTKSKFNDMPSDQLANYSGDLVLESSELSSAFSNVYCVYEIVKNVLLLGCDTGLWSYNQLSKTLVQITGISAVTYMSINKNLCKSILIADDGDNIYQCDFRHLQNRAQASACLKPKLDTVVIELPFANRVSSERWHYAIAHGFNETPGESLLIACTSCRIVILRFDMAINRYKPICALDTAMPVSSILFTRHTAIVAADKFFEIDLNSLSAEEFLNESDPSIVSTKNCRPMASFRINKQEFLLCFEEFGVFVDEYGSRSRPNDVNWANRPTAFTYRDPLLFVTYSDMVQVLRINKSFTSELELKHKQDEGEPNEIRAFISMKAPKIVGESDPLGIYVVSKRIDIEKKTIIWNGDVVRIDGMQALKSHMSTSLETFFSSLASIPQAIAESSDTISSDDNISSSS